MEKRKSFSINPIAAMGICLLLTISCSKDDDNNSINAIMDIDGNVYHTDTIGTQVWMVENLRTTHYADGTPITKVTGSANWDALTATSQAYCWYNDDSTTNAGTYGALYTWAAAMKGSTSTTEVPIGIQGVCPTGWHLPSYEEWTTMEDYLIANGNNYDGTTNNNKIAKSLAATNHWSSSSYVGTPGNTDYPTYRNKSGFTALPAGGHYEEGGFYDMGHWAMWWTSTELNSGYAYYRYVVYDSPNEGSDNYKKEVGFSVRCVRD